MIILPQYKVYLAGPITGLTYDQAANDWRKDVTEKLRDLAPHIHPFSPMRGKQHLVKHGVKPLPGAPNSTRSKAISTDRAIITRDSHDVRTADALFINFLPAMLTGRVSIGTVWEMGHASAFNIPMIVVSTPDNPHHHLFVEATAGYVVDNIAEGLEILIHLFTPGY